MRNEESGVGGADRANDDPRRYEDIIDLPHHVSAVHPRMSMRNRAGQFAPFAALTGYGESIAEAGRLTERRVELTEAEKAELNDRLSALLARLPARVTLTHFVPDARKAGGRYVTEDVVVRQILPTEGQLALADDRRVDLDCVLDVERGERAEGPCVK